MVSKDMKLSSDICVAPKTVVIVCKQNKDSEERVTGEKLFSKLKQSNSGCTWNQQFNHAMKKVVYVGSLRPHTVLIYGTTDHIEALRSAWIKNLLRSPEGFSILYFGELQSLYIEPVSQANFTPLPDALCSIILNMNQHNKAATLASLKSQLEQHYSQVQTPSDQVVYEVLNTLMKEKKLCLTDAGYFLTGERRDSLSMVFANDCGEVVTPLITASPAKRYRPSPKKSHANVRRTKSVIEKSKSCKSNLVYANNLNNKNLWNDEGNQPRKAKVQKDKGTALRKLFGLKSKKKIHKAGSTGSGSSTQSLSTDDEPNPVSVQPYCIDSRNTSQLTSALMPLRLSPMPMNNTVDESLRVHCGKTLIHHHSQGSDSDEFETDYEDEEEDCVPELMTQPIRNSYTRSTYHAKRRISDPSHGWRQRRSSSTDTTDSNEFSTLPTAHMYFERKRSKSMHITKKGRTTLPNVSSIKTCSSSTIRVPNNSPPSTPSMDGRQSAEGENPHVAHHSTPNEPMTQSRRAFNATGHTDCDVDCHNEIATTPQKSNKKTMRRSSYYTRNSQKYNNETTGNSCECSTFKCMCSCNKDVEDSTEGMKLNRVYNRLSQEAFV